ncbi:general secretion pathway protein M [Sphingomonas gellani]|uniref:General secretion pathway protein M n=1 Tax=Sphingomonas gellani TaxID=1166340 RepID=A0A1H7YBJ2_9SPHN|nr:type II secretion system protein GspM [Sphingomonas gellani]SEM42559.1 general secretion pathway protein M [Sphingomonas gellani]
MTRAFPWFAARSLREQRLILVMLALLAVTVTWAGIIRPVGDALSSAQERQADAVTRLGETRAQVEAVRTAQALHGPALAGTLADTVRARADAAGFTLASLDPQADDRVHVTLSSARPGVLVAWLARLERAGVLIDSTRMTDNGDRTVSADLVLKAQGR